MYYIHQFFIIFLKTTTPVAQAQLVFVQTLLKLEWCI